MSGNVRRNREGVLLRYADPGVLRSFHGEQPPRPSDRERMAVIAADHELAVLRIIAEHLDLSDIGMTRIMDALETIGDALDRMRDLLGRQR